MLRSKLLGNGETLSGEGGVTFFMTNVELCGMAPAWVFGIVGVFLAIGLAWAGAGAVKLRRWWTMKRLDPVGPMAAETGLQEFEGTAHAVDGTVTAPFSGTESLVCKHKVQRYKHTSDGSNWTTIDTGTRTAPFEIESAGSSVAVDGQDAKHLLTEEYELDIRETEDIPDRIAEYMRREHDIKDLESSVNLGPMEMDKHQYRFKEERLEDGEAVYVLGTVRQDPSLVPDRADARIAISTSNQGLIDSLLGDPFVISDSGEEEAIRRQYKNGRKTTLLGLGLTAFSALALFFVVAG